MASHELPAEKLHYCWDNTIAPALEIEPGDSVLFETRDASDGNAWESFTRAKPAPSHPLTGPVYVKGAEPGDVLEIEVLEVRTVSRGWTSFVPGKGLLPDDFDKFYYRYWDLTRADGWAEFAPGINVPLEPFCGILGLAWDVPGQHSTVPPGRYGGNMDIKQLRAGSRLQLPVSVAGGLFSVGDCHAAQGDGEVCITAIETDGRVNLRFNLHKQMTLHEPRFWIDRQAASRGGDKGYFVTTSHAPDLRQASQNAVRYMIEYLVDNYQLTPQDAYILCSVTVDLKISQLVDAPNWTVSAFLPNAIFQE
jgi:acetamidase/formamidase